MWPDLLRCIGWGFALQYVVARQASNERRSVYDWAEDHVESLLTRFHHLPSLPPRLPRLYRGPDSRLASRNHSHRYPLVGR